jgi:hypothetical protein
MYNGYILNKEIQMTRKHFKIMAAEVAAIVDLTERKSMAERLAVMCKAANSRFDFARFYAACGV